MLRFYETERPSFVELANIVLVTVSDVSTLPEKEREALIQSPNAGKVLQPKINPQAIQLIQKHCSMKTIAQNNQTANNSKLAANSSSNQP